MLGLQQRKPHQRYAGALLALLLGIALLVCCGPQNNPGSALPSLLNPVLADNTQTPFTGSKEHELTITLQAPAQSKANTPPATAKTGKKEILTEPAQVEPNDVLKADQEPAAETRIFEANTSNAIEYTIQSDLPGFKTVNDEISTTTLEKPFLPSQSLSYLVTTDSSIANEPAITLLTTGNAPAPGQNKLTGEEKLALQRELHYNKEDLARLQEAIANLALAPSGTFTPPPPASNTNPKTLALLGALQQQLAEKEQLIRLLQERLNKASRDYLGQQKQFQRSLKQRRIIYI